MSETKSTSDYVAPHPQDDLYNAVNGQWLHTYEMPADRAVDGAFRDLAETALEQCREICEAGAGGLARPADACIDAEQWEFNLSRLNQIYRAYSDVQTLNELGISPVQDMLDKVNATQDHKQLAGVYGELEKVGGGAPISAYISIDPNEPTRYMLQFYQGGLGLPDESYYRGEENEQLRQAYVAYMRELLQVSGLAADEQAATEWADELMRFETAIAEGHWDRVKCRDAKASNNAMQWADFATEFPGFDYEAWAKGCELDDAAAKTGGEVNVGMPSFQKHFAKLWSETPLYLLKRYICFQIVSGFGAYLTDDIQKVRFSFYGQILSGTPERSELWKRATGIAESKLGQALGQIYVSLHFPPAHKQQMEQLVQSLCKAYEISISKLAWMSPATRERALEKLSQFTPKIGYPNRWVDDRALVFADDDSLVQMVQKVNMFWHRYELARVGGPIDPEEWHMTPQTVNAYYNPTANEIVFPAAILQAPFFSPEASAAENFGGIGAVIGHEIGHGFDDQGSEFDGTGKMSDWWSEEDRKAFKQLTAALVDQYEGLVPAVLAGEDVGVSGELTLGENIGDLGGLGIAIQAFALVEPQQAQDSEQMRELFNNWARVWKTMVRPEEARRRLVVDPHSPAEFRCNQIAKNLDEFHKAFETKPGDAMWLAPESRIRIWN